jgi:hypothetical protein
MDIHSPQFVIQQRPTMYTNIHSPQFVTQGATDIEYLLPTIFAWSRGLALLIYIL